MNALNRSLAYHVQFPDSPQFVPRDWPTVACQPEAHSARPAPYITVLPSSWLTSDEPENAVPVAHTAL